MQSAVPPAEHCCASNSAMQDDAGTFFPTGRELSPARTLHVIGKGDTIVSMGGLSANLCMSKVKVTNRVSLPRTLSGACG